MPTTPTLDKSLAKIPGSVIRSSIASLKLAVKTFLRLDVNPPVKPSPKRFVVRPRAMGIPAGKSYDNIKELLEAVEGKTRK